MLDIIKNLNEQQKLAVETTEGPLIVIAGAGSGKTSVLTRRIAYLISEKNISENNILAITFTNKAAKEMKERIHSLVGETAKYIWISTFHSMCVRILRQHIELLNYNKNFTILDPSEQKLIIKNILKELNYSEDEYEPNVILNIISKNKNENVSSTKLLQTVRWGFMEKVANIYDSYQKYLKKYSVLDFDDLLIKVIELFEKYPEVLDKYQNKFKYIHVDEYQDTNLIQYKLIQLLSNNNRNICIVGDDDQSIYSWRGARSDNLINFESDFPEFKLIVLDQNYRSNNVILDAANNVIKNNKIRKEKNLWSAKKGGNKINVYAAFNEIDEVEYIAKKIKNAINEGIEYKDIAILYRANYLSRIIENTLLSNSIPYKLVGSLKFLQRQEIKDILAYVNVIVNPQAELSLRRIINVPKRGIGPTSIEKIEKYMEQHNMTFYDTLSKIEQVGLSKKSTQEIIKLQNIFKKYSNFKKFTIDEIIMGIYLDSGYSSMLKEANDEHSNDRISNISELVSSAKQYSEMNNSIIDYVTEMSLMADSDDENFENSVTLSTIHAAKGLEYGIVFVVGLEENIFPSIKNSDDFNDEQTKMEEERRLAYVAITRAKNELYLSYSNRRMQFGAVKYNEVSRFIKEIPTTLVNLEKNTQLESIHSLGIEETKRIYISKLTPTIKEKIVNKDKSTYNIGDRVGHRKFGSGIITAITVDSITINFDNLGDKILLKEYANLSKE
ncbi:MULTISPECIES: ATP-dependent helicase [unclassified Gemella]|uniref:ATP-dependent helicase n=1 Tax=unclassified Gemella TaxID=2624949 RepID=UPI001073F88C|nr:MULTISPECIES: UvrD-helicase domain-containing protein [unclassified Gemella]MBF0710136.1 exodeoxyribonuclease V subunit gamma [Gemella sp. GL1.1]MBF0746215.1 exodeoxyribonuclease V subunit gamma [Gemella sp. 19428wG2_WT2a]NYS27480.1 exodeoxyribonuclease V subunit gamma [Gemella sp. GL1]TFU60498.1 ATP-dependent helicase [Gemella sp. WT2a]